MSLHIFTYISMPSHVKLKIIIFILILLYPLTNTAFSCTLTQTYTFTTVTVYATVVGNNPSTNTGYASASGNYVDYGQVACGYVEGKNLMTVVLESDYLTDAKIIQIGQSYGYSFGSGQTGSEVLSEVKYNTCDNNDPAVFAKERGICIYDLTSCVNQTEMKYFV